jgi:hypothetical protein
MSKPTFSPFIDSISKITNINITETIFPISKMTCKFSPMVTGDDVALRTSLVSPVSYDRELCKLIIKHLTIVGQDEDYKINFNDLVSSISNIDKLSAIWALYKATYEDLAEGREVKCDNPQCTKTFKVDIKMDDLIHDDTYTIWDMKNNEGEDIPFTVYRTVISIEHQDLVFDFNSRIPSIKDNNDLLSVISIDTLQYNLENIKSIFSRPQHMTLLTDAVRVSSKSNAFTPIETNNFNEILLTFNNYLPFQVSEKFFTKYNDEFGKYSPNYYKNIVCEHCGQKIKYEIDLETEFFRKCLSI